MVAYPAPNPFLPGLTLISRHTLSDVAVGLTTSYGNKMHQRLTKIIRCAGFKPPYFEPSPRRRKQSDLCIGSLCKEEDAAVSRKASSRRV